MPLKIFCEVSNGASTFIRTGWKNAFEALGHRFVFFPEHSNTFDLFNTLGSPDILIATTYNLNNSLFKLIKRNPGMKVILFGSAYGPVINQIDLNRYPIDYAKENEIDNINNLKQMTGKPDYIFIHTPDFYVNDMLGYWKSKVGVEIFGLMNAADTIVYKKLTTKNDRFACDIGYVGGYWPYKARSLDKYLIKLCNEQSESSEFNIKIFGNGWNIPQFLGGLGYGDDNLVFNNSIICPNISEEHSYLIPDFIERLFKVPAAGGFLISDDVKKLEHIYPNCIVPTFKNYDEFVDLIRMYLKNNELREMVKDLQIKHVLNNHTYFHRISKMLKLLGYEKESNEMLLRGKNV